MQDWLQSVYGNLGKMYAPNYGSLDPQAQQQASQNAMFQLGVGMLDNSTKNPAQAFGSSARGLQQAGTQAMQAQAMAETMNDRRNERNQKQRRLQALGQFMSAPGIMQGMPEGFAGLAQQDPETAFSIWSASRKGQDMTDDQREYSAAVSQGYQGTLADWLGKGKESNKRTQVVDIGGKQVLVDMDTGQPIRELGQAGTREQTVPASVQSDVAKTNAAYDTLSSELDDYIKMVEQGGASWIPGTQERDAIGQKMRNIQLQAKELYNLGVLNGPDLALMEEMLFDPRVGITNPTAAFGAAGRAKRSANAFREILKRIRDNKQKLMQQGGAEQGTSGGEAVDWQEYFGGQ